MNFLETATYENLKRAFISECTARTRYEFVEYGQRMQGLEGLATITDKVAYQEFNHARMLYTVLCQKTGTNPMENVEICMDVPFRERWDILDNLKAISNDEADEAIFYEKSAKTALKEGFKDIAELFTNIRKVELKHKKIFEYLYDGYKNGTLYKSDSKRRYICPSCGHEMYSEEAEKTCPLCQAKMQTFTVLLPKELAF